VRQLRIPMRRNIKRHDLKGPESTCPRPARRLALRISNSNESGRTKIDREEWDWKQSIRHSPQPKAEWLFLWRVPHSCAWKVSKNNEIRLEWLAWASSQEQERIRIFWQTSDLVSVHEGSCVKLTQGENVKPSRYGNSGHQHNPTAYIPTRNKRIQ
jgi:hypothetical protein